MTEPRIERFDYGHGRTPQEQVLPPAANPMVEGAEAILSGNPVTIGKEILKVLQRIDRRAEIERQLEEKVREQRLRKAQERESWQSFGFRFDPTDPNLRQGVMELEFSHSANIKYMQITTAATDGAGFFYLAFVSPLTFDGSGRPDPDTWEQVSAIGGPSLTIPVPSGAPKVFWYSTVRHEGTVYVATSKDALPS